MTTTATTTTGSVSPDILSSRQLARGASTRRVTDCLISMMNGLFSSPWKVSANNINAVSEKALCDCGRSLEAQFHSALQARFRKKIFAALTLLAGFLLSANSLYMYIYIVPSAFQIQDNRTLLQSPTSQAPEQLAMLLTQQDPADPSEALKSMSSLRASFERPGEIKDRLQVAMIMSKVNKNFCKTLYSALATGYEAPRLLNYNHAFHGGYSDKLWMQYKHLEQRVDFDEHVLFVDGYDVWFQLPPRILLDRFKRIGRSVVFGADKKCWPNKPSSKGCQKMPPSPLAKDVYGDWTDKEGLHEYARPRWLNMGALMGTGIALKPLYREGIRRSKGVKLEKIDDQRIFSEVLADFPRYNYTLDHFSQLFQTMTLSHNDIVWEVNPDSRNPASVWTDKANSQALLNLDDVDLAGDEAQRGKSFWWGKPLARNKIANTIPAILHFNGRKTFLSWWWSFTWYAQKDYREQVLETFLTDDGPGQAGAWDGQHWLSWSSLCGTVDIF